jgi:hypothetical protein
MSLVKDHHHSVRLGARVPCDRWAR